MLKHLLESDKIPEDYLKKEWEAAFKKAEIQIKEQAQPVSNKWLERPSYTLTCLEKTQPGDIIKFNGYECIVVNPLSGYLIFKEPILSLAFDKLGGNIPDPDKQGNIFHELNSNFLDGIGSSLRALIRPYSWKCNSDHFIYSHVGIPSFIDICQLKDYGVAVDNVWLRDTPDFKVEKGLFDTLLKNEQAMCSRKEKRQLITSKRKMGAYPSFHLHPRAEIYDGVITGSMSPIFDFEDTNDRKELHQLPAYSIIQFADFLCILINPKNGYIFMIDSLGNLLFDTHEPTWYGKQNPNNIEVILNDVFYTKIPDRFRKMIKLSKFNNKQSYVGLLSNKEWEGHSARIHHYKNSYGDGWGWTRTTVETSSTGTAVYAINPNGNIMDWRIYYERKLPVHPTFYLSPNTYVDRYGNVLT